MSTPLLRPATKGPAYLPAPGSTRAPEKIRGDGTQLKYFLKEFEGHANDQELTDEERVRLVLKYVDGPTREYWMTLKGYKRDDWAQLKEELYEAYPGSKQGHHYTRRHLKKLASDHAKKRLDNEAKFAEYYHQFCRIAECLVEDNELTEKE
ncbi:hypothetical protein F5878DRAFT_549050, partial [Lentinula raphanica]